LEEIEAKKKEKLLVQEENLKHTEAQIAETKTILEEQKAHIKEYNSSIEEQMAELNSVVLELKKIDSEIETVAAKNDKLESDVDVEQKESLELKLNFDKQLNTLEDAHSAKLQNIENQIQESIALREKHATDHQATVATLQEEQNDHEIELSKLQEAHELQDDENDAVEQEIAVLKKDQENLEGQIKAADAQLVEAKKDYDAQKTKATNELQSLKESLKVKMTDAEEALEQNLKESLEAEQALAQEKEDTKQQIEQTTRLLTSSQKNLDEALEDQKDARARLASLEADEARHTKDLEDANQTLLTFTERAEAAKKNWDQKLSETTEKYQAELKDYQDAIADQVDLYNEYNDKFTSQQAARVAAELELADKIKTLEGEVKVLENQKKEEEVSLEMIESQISSANDEIINTHDKLSATKTLLADKKVELEETYDKQAAAFEYSIKAREEQLARDTKDAEEALAQTNKFKATLAEVEENPWIIEKLRVRKETLEKELTQQDELIAGLKEDRAKLDLELIEAEKEAEVARTDLKEYETEQLANFESRIIEYSAEFDTAKERVSQYEADMMAAANGFTAIESDAEKERREEVETIMQARADLSDAKADMKDAMESKEAKEATRAKHEKNMKAMTAELEASNESLTDIEQLIASVPEGERADLEA